MIMMLAEMPVMMMFKCSYCYSSCVCRGKDTSGGGCGKVGNDVDISTIAGGGGKIVILIMVSIAPDEDTNNNGENTLAAYTAKFFSCASM